jgi:hypothetical protein
MPRLTPLRFQFEELRVGAIVFVLMLLPVGGVMAVLQLFVPTKEVQRIVSTTYAIDPAPRLQLYVFYLTAAVAHVIVTALVITFLRKGLQQNISATKHGAITLGVYSFSALIIGLFLISAYLNPVLSTLSHERVYAVLERSPLFAPYFAPVSLRGLVPSFYRFSVVPVSLIVLGLIVIVLTCFSVGRDVTVVTNSIRSRPTADKRRDIDLKIRSFHIYFYVLSSVLVTSTIATALFLKLPLTSIAAGDGYSAFSDLSNAMSVCWGITFSLTMLAMCFYPYFRIQRDLRALLKDSRITDDRELQQWITDIQQNYVIYANLKSLLAIFVPAAVGALSRFI